MTAYLPGFEPEPDADDCPDRDKWQTDPRLFDLFSVRLGFRFDIDLFASAHNALCQRYLTEADDTYSLSWRYLQARYPGADRCWGNPPFGKGKDGEAVRWAYENTRPPSSMIVAILTFVKPDLPWWAEYASKAAQRFEIQGRVGYLDPATGKQVGSPDRGSVVHVFCPWSEGPPTVIPVRRPW